MRKKTTNLFLEFMSIIEINITSKMRDLDDGRLNNKPIIPKYSLTTDQNSFIKELNESG